MPSQRDLVEVSFRCPPDGEFLNHPVLVLSNDDINEHEGAFLGMMMTSHNWDDAYSFVVNNEDFVKPLGERKHAEFRLHLVSQFLESDIIPNNSPKNSMKKASFMRLIEHFNEITIGLK
jgi:hypothetical protein